MSEIGLSPFMNYILTFMLVIAGLFAGILVLLETGRRLRIWRGATPAGPGPGAAVLEGAVFGLMSLMIAFTFNGASSRLDERRHLAVEEANAIGTAYLRIDLLPSDVQPELRDKFRQFVDARLAFYRNVSRADQAQAELSRAAELQHEIWAMAVAGTQRAASPAVTTLVLPALNEMFKLSEMRTVALETHPPSIIFAMLGILVLSCSMIAGDAMEGSGARHWVQRLVFAVMMTIVIYVILDIEYPRMGLITADTVDRVLLDLRQSMH
ncbi:MAG: DUF4239 domain-containing protein [Bryobacteraceae bacterium]